ncbi:unnamed protein product [Gulo gulo]|uniref:Uncharacterized protein n=1 Tax=Gulo gulo TaxID=48420 RepID=A0A9X9PY79_GULGU|nr:unnamed protein product [Gulo gulo]
MAGPGGEVGAASLESVPGSGGLFSAVGCMDRREPCSSA